MQSRWVCGGIAFGLLATIGIAGGCSSKGAGAPAGSGGTAGTMDGGAAGDADLGPFNVFDGGALSNGAVEDDGIDCTIGALPDASTLPAIAELPDPFLKLDGTEMTTKAEWHCRREELRRLAETYVYGTKPAPPMVGGTVSSTLITVQATVGANTASFSATVTLPSTGSPPYPAIIGYGGAAPLDMGVIDSEGVAVITYDPQSVGKEGNSHSLLQSGAFYSLYSGGSQTGLLIAWGWGVSRIIDVIAASGGGLIDPTAIGVTGCSRYGKGAFIAGAFDERIALTLPVEPGTAGVPAWRGIALGQVGANGNPSQSLSAAYSEQPWFANAFFPFLNSATTIPLDTHEVLAMIAPRGVFIMDNPYIGELSPQFGDLAALAAAEVYTALGAQGNLSYHSNIQDGTHCAMRPEWSAPLQDVIEKFLKRTGTAAGAINPSSIANIDLASWRQWTTPTLN